jgi:hypothetical protein
MSRVAAVVRAASRALFVAALTCSPARAGDQDAKHAAVPVVQVVRAVAPVAIDGKLNDEVWSVASPATDFIQTDPDEGKPATERTEVRVAYDASALYVGARLHDAEAAKISRQLSRRDQDAEADWFSVYLDPHHDHLTGAVFRVSAAGVQGDAIIHNDERIDESWDAVWTSAVTVDETGWTVELRIPFSQLRFPAAERHIFGINVLRHIQRKNERDWLVYVPKTESGLASRMGHLTGFEGLAPRRTLELLPYAVSRAEFIAPADGDPFNDGARMFGGTGLDVKYRVTSSLTLDGAINPDFGQVEVDPAVVNLTAFETFFEEKRPFFIEGANIFENFGRGGANNFWGFNRSEPLIFYSRRIGRSPQGEADGDFVNQPSSSTILGAAKLTGKTRTGWSLGLLEAVTGRERAQVVTNGLGSRTEVEPLSNYFVGRLQRETGRRGAVGLLVTAVNRDLRAPALRDRLVAQSYVGGADAHYFLDKKRDWVVTGRLAASHVTGSSSAISELQRAPQRYFQRPDAPHVGLDADATTMRGWTGSVNVNRNSGIHQVNSALWATSPGFESNDAGFNFNGDRAGYHAVYSWNNPKVNRFARRRSISVAKWYTWNFTRELQGDGIHTFGNLQFKNYWSLFSGGMISRSIQDDRATRGGPAMLRPMYWAGFGGIETDSRKRLSFGVDLESVKGEDGGSAFFARLGPRYRPSASLELSVSPAFSRQQLPAQYVATFEDSAATATFGSRYLFATLDHKEFSLQTRVNYVLSPKMSLQVYAQPLFSVGNYDTFKELARPRSYDFTRFGVDRGSLAYDAAARLYTVEPGDGGRRFEFDDPDFNFKSLRLNAIFRWEWRPGSALYLVWTEQREDVDRPGQFTFRRDFGTLFRADPDDVILFKIAYWFSR